VALIILIIVVVKIQCKIFDMGDSVADREASFTSLNRHSWTLDEDELKSTEATPLVGRRSPAAKQSSRAKQAQAREGGLGHLSLGPGTSRSFSSVDGIWSKSLFATKTAIGEVLVLASWQTNNKSDLCVWQ
jgi:hypothetical protein